MPRRCCAGEHPVRGLVPAPTFIKLLEETGLIDDVGFGSSSKRSASSRGGDRRAWHLESIAVNLSTRQLQATSLPASRWARCCDRHGLRTERPELEVTESIFMGDASAAIRTLEVVYDSGIRIALDDFGTGYSSLSYLHKLPIGVMKVDRSFVAELGQRDSALALARSVVASGARVGSARRRRRRRNSAATRRTDRTGL